MSAACRVNPLQQFVLKGEQHHRFHGSQLGQNFNNNEGTQDRMATIAPDRHFLKQNETQNAFLELQQPSPMFPMNHASTQSRGEDWMQEFSSLQVKDPLEFCEDYKQLYSNYEATQFQSRPQPQRIQPHQSIYRQPLGTQYFASSKTGKETHSTYDEEFKNLEKELQNSELSDDVEMFEHPGKYTFDAEQVEFQRIANDIIDSCSSVSNSPSPVSSKLSSSKFMKLMRGISEGSVTLKKDDDMVRELHSPENGKIVGNDYFPVSEETHQRENIQ